MLLTIPKLLNTAQLDKIHELLTDAEFIDGRLSAGFAAAKVKHNQEMRQDPQRMQVLVRILMASLGHHETFRFGVLPHRVADPIFARYQPGMTYGDHVDDPIMGSSSPRFRTDVSMTVFLNPPDAYDGGELVIRTSFGERKVKLPAGDAVVYPSSSLHQVAPSQLRRAAGGADLDPELRARPGQTRVAVRVEPSSGNAAETVAGGRAYGAGRPQLRQPGAYVERVVGGKKKRGWLVPKPR